MILSAVDRPLREALASVTVERSFLDGELGVPAPEHVGVLRAALVRAAA